MPAEALAEIQRMAGTHLDPEVVDAFVDLYKTNVIRDLDSEMSPSSYHPHGDLDDDLTLVA